MSTDAIIAHEGPYDDHDLKEALEATLRVRDALAMVLKRFVRMAEDTGPNVFLWKPTPNVTVRSEHVRASDAHIYGILAGGRRSEVIIPEPTPTDSSHLLDQSGRVRARKALDHVEAACDLLRAAMRGERVDPDGAAAMIAADAVDAGWRAKDPVPCELRVRAPTPWTDAKGHERECGMVAYVDRFPSREYGSMRRCVSLDVSGGTANFSKMHSDVFPGLPTPMEILRIHARAGGEKA